MMQVYQEGRAGHRGLEITCSPFLYHQAYGIHLGGKLGLVVSDQFWRKSQRTAGEVTDAGQAEAGQSCPLCAEHRLQDLRATSSRLAVPLFFLLTCCFLAAW